MCLDNFEKLVFLSHNRFMISFCASYVMFSSVTEIFAKLHVFFVRKLNIVFLSTLSLDSTGLGAPFEYGPTLKERNSSVNFGPIRFRSFIRDIGALPRCSLPTCLSGSSSWRVRFSLSSLYRENQNNQGQRSLRIQNPKRQNVFSKTRIKSLQKTRYYMMCRHVFAKSLGEFIIFSIKNSFFFNE